ncbi:hypothetical protein ACFL5O_07105, partial [Myxococcota bacterium]
RVGTRARIDFGPELEIPMPRTDVDGDGDREMDPRANLDFPFAVHWGFGASGFFGLRTGIFLPEMRARDVSVKLGIEGGPILADGDVDWVFWFLWPALLRPGHDPGPLNGDEFQLGTGLSIRIGT